MNSDKIFWIIYIIVLLSLLIPALVFTVYYVKNTKMKSTYVNKHMLPTDLNNVIKNIIDDTIINTNQINIIKNYINNSNELTNFAKSNLEKVLEYRFVLDNYQIEKLSKEAELYNKYKNELYLTYEQLSLFNTYSKIGEILFNNKIIQDNGKYSVDDIPRIKEFANALIAHLEPQIDRSAGNYNCDNDADSELCDTIRSNNKIKQLISNIQNNILNNDLSEQISIKIKDYIDNDLEKIIGPLKIERIILEHLVIIDTNQNLTEEEVNYLKDISKKIPKYKTTFIVLYSVAGGIILFTLLFLLNDAMQPFLSQTKDIDIDPLSYGPLYYDPPYYPTYGPSYYPPYRR
jgi:hypothetical protein